MMDARTLRVLDVFRALRAETGSCFEAGRVGRSGSLVNVVAFIALDLSIFHTGFLLWEVWALLRRQVSTSVVRFAHRVR